MAQTTPTQFAKNSHFVANQRDGRKKLEEDRLRMLFFFFDTRRLRGHGRFWFAVAATLADVDGGLFFFFRNMLVEQGRKGGRE